MTVWLLGHGEGVGGPPPMRSVKENFTYFKRTNSPTIFIFISISKCQCCVSS